MFVFQDITSYHELPLDSVDRYCVEEMVLRGLSQK